MNPPKNGGAEQQVKNAISNKLHHDKKNFRKQNFREKIAIIDFNSYSTIKTLVFQTHAERERGRDRDKNDSNIGGVLLKIGF